MLYNIYSLNALIFLAKLLSSGFANDTDENFEFTRVEPGNQIGITTKVIAHIHRPAKSTTETWTLNREFTPDPVVKALNETCSEKLIDKKLKWSNCRLDANGFTAELTHGRPESKNKTFVYLAVSYQPYEREDDNGKTHTCELAIVEENPVYFLLETFSKIPSNDSFPKSPQESVDALHVHQLGKFGKEFLSIYGDSIDQDGIYNFDVMDYNERDELYECFLSIGSSESVSVLEEKCPIYCIEPLNHSELAEELANEESDSDVYILDRKYRSSMDKSDSERDESSEETSEEEVEYSDDEEEVSLERNTQIHNEL